jgi:hypothetical protein
LKTNKILESLIGEVSIFTSKKKMNYVPEAMALIKAPSVFSRIHSPNKH